MWIKDITKPLTRENITKTLTLENFYKSFLKKVGENKVRIEIDYKVDIENNTNYFMDLIMSLLEDILAVEYRCDSYRKSIVSKEHYQIDMIACTSRIYKEMKDIDEIREERLNKHVRNFDIAIEYESNCHDWLDKVVKLAYINCPIRVVIGYVDRRRSDSTEDADSYYLNAVIKTLNELEKQNSTRIYLIKENDSFGIILGSGNVDKRDFSFDYIQYKLYYIYYNEVEKHHMWIK